MASPDDSDTARKPQQFLKVQADEEMWISGEELRTDGSSDDEKSPAQTSHHRKSKIRRKSKDINKHRIANAEEAPPFIDFNPRQPEAAASSTEGIDEASSPNPPDNEWRPKRGSLKLPELMADDEGSHGIRLLQEIVDRIDALRYVPRKAHLTAEVNEKVPDDKVDQLWRSIAELEENVKEKIDKLQIAKVERLKAQQEMCREIYRDERFFDRDATHFLNLCHFEETSQQSSDSDGEVADVDGNDTKKQRQRKLRWRKDFIGRNIELAAKAMTNLPLTDEEKQKLEKLLSEEFFTEDEKQEEIVKVEDEEIDLEEDLVLGNAFHVSEADKRRIGEIDSELEQFVETQSARADDDAGGNFWRNLVLDQALKEIDSKLASLENDQ